MRSINTRGGWLWVVVIGPICLTYELLMYVGVACCATKFANGVMNSDPSCATVECSPFLNQATPTAPAADAPAPATDAVPAPTTDAVPAPTTDAVPAPATEAVPAPDTVIESPVIPSRPPVGEVLTDAAISPQALFGTAVAIILAVVA
jgi:hypothetical protein